MSRVPGNLATIGTSCGSSGCHADVAARVDKSLMRTLSGLISVDRWVLGETSSPDLPHNVQHLGHSPAERHLRQLCVSCHLGAPKTAPGPITEESRGGGCSACHLRYDASSLASLALKGSPFPSGQPLAHPEISLRLAPDACLGCHSRSGRISLGYEGWHEAGTTRPPDDAREETMVRQLQDGRSLKRMPADIHHEKGLVCIDCHGALELMGDGLAHLHQEEARRSSCKDCHPAGAAVPAASSALDPETRSLLRLRGLEDPAAGYVIGRRGQGYPNLRVEEGRVVLLGKEDGRRHPAKAMPPSCGGRDGAHARLSCDTCHAAWAPQCISCHTREDSSQPGWDLLADRETRGTWVERSGAQHADRPVLGLLRDSRDAPDKPAQISAFVPGMILRFQRAGQPDPEFRRLHAPSNPHTTRAEARSCEGCHLDSLALGYGRGRLAYVTDGSRGIWTFAPAMPLAREDGLPEDAWLPFLTAPKPGLSTREAASPLGIEEQRRLLLVGSCLSCHKASDTAFRRRLLDFPSALAARGRHCIEPDWEAR